MITRRRGIALQIRLSVGGGFDRLVLSAFFLFCYCFCFELAKRRHRGGCK
jgi:hypothetical protein